MDTLLEYLYCDVMNRCWDNTARQKAALQEWAKAEGKSWDDIDDAAQLLAEEASFAAFLAAFHLGCALENALRQQLEPRF